MRVVFRVDSSVNIGTGHVYRCLALATYLRKVGASVLFMSRCLEGSMCSYLESLNYEVCRLFSDCSRLDGSSGETTADDLDSRSDAVQASSILMQRAKYDWLVVDNYGIDHNWESHVRQYVGNILVIDDWPNRSHNCDILVNQNYVSSQSINTNVETSSIRELLGPRYALLQDEYHRLRSKVRNFDRGVKRLFVFFGGSDSTNLTSTFVKAFNSLDCQSLMLDLVIGLNNPNKELINEECKNNPAIQLHYNRPSLSTLMLEADLAVGGCGITTWERCALGLPSLVITMADNQERVARDLDKDGYIRWIGAANKVSYKQIGHELKEMISSENLPMMRRDVYQLVDGNGVARVYAAMCSTPDVQLRIRIANEQDEDIYLEWRNDRDVRINSFNTEEISFEEHHKWFLKNFNNKDVVLYMLETLDGLPVGQARFEKECSVWNFHYSVDGIYRGLGYGTRLVQMAVELFSRRIDNVKVKAEVRKGNVKSCNIFEKAGFNRIEDSDVYVYMYCGV